MRSVTESSGWKTIVNAIQSGDLSNFSTLINCSSVIASAINLPDIKGSTLLHHIARNANARSVDALENLISLAIKNGIKLQSLLNKQDKDGNTPLTLCVKSVDSSNLAARILLMKELLTQGADPTLGNKQYLLTLFSKNDQNAIKLNPVLKVNVRECQGMINSFIHTQELQEKRAVMQEALKKLTITTCGSAQRQTGSPPDQALSPTIK